MTDQDKLRNILEVFAEVCGGNVTALNDHVFVAAGRAWIFDDNGILIDVQEMEFHDETT